MVHRAILYVGLLALGFGWTPASSTSRNEAVRSFAEMKQLVGTWRIAGDPRSPLRIEFSLTAGGTALVERWMQGDRDHSLTMYHIDGATITATHYCPQGNQPRLTSRPQAESKIVKFAFRDATDLNAGEAHLIALSFDLNDEAVLVRRETYRQSDSEDLSELKLSRDD